MVKNFYPKIAGKFFEILELEKPEFIKFDSNSKLIYLILKPNINSLIMKLVKKPYFHSLFHFFSLYSQPI